jgi:hypothetical protein
MVIVQERVLQALYDDDDGTFTSGKPGISVNMTSWKRLAIIPISLFIKRFANPIWRQHMCLIVSPPLQDTVGKRD